MEQNMFIGNHSTGGGVRAFLGHIDVLSTYLPLFPPLLNVAYQELTNQEKQLMLFDALPKDYIDQMKKANQVPLEMPLEELRSYALNIEKPKSTKSRIQIQLRLRITPIVTIPPCKIMVSGMLSKKNSRKERRMVKEIIHLQFSMGKQSLFVLFVEILAMLKSPAELKKEQ
jgi:hypothetical protein